MMKNRKRSFARSDIPSDILSCNKRMSSIYNSAVHSGIQCNSCGASNFGGIRFKCLFCEDFDLCGRCQEKQLYDFEYFDPSDNHSNEHPVQSILTSKEIELYYSKEIVPSSLKSLSLTCPICNKMGFTIPSLTTHVITEHADDENLLLCPICAQANNANSTEFVENLSKHLTEKHRIQPRQLFVPMPLSSNPGLLNYLQSPNLPQIQRVQQMSQLENREFFSGQVEHPANSTLTHLAEEIAKQFSDSLNLNFSYPITPTPNIVTQNLTQPLVNETIDKTPKVATKGIFSLDSDSSEVSDSDDDTKPTFKTLKARYLIPTKFRVSDKQLTKFENKRSEKSQFVNSAFADMLQQKDFRDSRRVKEIVTHKASTRSRPTEKVVVEATNSKTTTSVKNSKSSTSAKSSKSASSAKTSKQENRFTPM